MLIKLFSFLLLVSFCLGQFGRVQFGQGIGITLLDLVVGSFFLVSLFKIVFKKKIRKVSQEQLFSPFVIFLIICLLSLVHNPLSLRMHELQNSALYLVRFVLYFGLFFLLSQFSQKEKQNVLIAISFGVFVAVAIGFFQLLYYPNLGNLFYLGWDDHLYRLFSVFLDPNFAGVIFSLLFFFLLGKFLETNKRDLRKIVLLANVSFLTVLAVFLTYSRTGMITLVVGTVALLLLRGYKRLLAVCLVLFVLILFASSNLKVEGLNPFRKASSSARITSLKTALAIWQKQPILGVGFNTYRYAQNIYGYRIGGAWETSHADAGTDNSFLFVLVTTGIAGFVAYIYLWWVILTSSWKKVRDGKSIFPAVVFSSLLAILVSSMFLNTLFYPFVLVWMIVLLSTREST